MGFLVNDLGDILSAMPLYSDRRTCDHCTKPHPAPDVRKATIDHEGNTKFLCPGCFAERGIEVVGKSLLELMNSWDTTASGGG